MDLEGSVSRPNNDDDNDDAEVDGPSTSSSHTTEAPPPPRARDHSYLPTSHPLHAAVPHNRQSEESSTAQSIDIRSHASSRTHATSELAVLELPGVILFPGSTFPLRFPRSDSSSTSGGWIQYLGKQIQASRTAPGRATEIQLGILTAKPPPDWERAEHVDRRRQSWTRQGFGPERLRRLSQQLIQELGDVNELSDSDEDEDLDVDYGVATTNTAASGNLPAIRTATGSVNTSAVKTNDRCGYIGRIGTVVTVMNTHGDEAFSTSENRGGTTASSLWRNTEEGGQLVLTTLATSRFRIIGYCHPSDEHEMYQRAILQRHIRRAVSTSVPKFLVEWIGEESLPLPPHYCPMSSMPRKDSTNDRALHHDTIIRSVANVSPIPGFVFRRVWPWRLLAKIRMEMSKNETFRDFWDPETIDSSCSDDEEEAMAWTCETTDTESPSAIRVMNENELENDPVKMSFWLASNLPFSEDEKLHLLEMLSSVERLQFIFQRVKEHSEPLICCQTCGVNLSQASSMFKLGGAEGTTGAYVNEHGFVHQTITVRRLLCLGQNPRQRRRPRQDEGSDIVAFTGGPQTKDSWFPGYSWTIMSCSLCDSHLGWKFLKVDRSSHPPTIDRPNMFYGLSGASVVVATPHRRV